MHMNEWTPLGQPGLSKFALRTWRTPLVLLLICCLFVVSAPLGQMVREVANSAQSVNSSSRAITPRGTSKPPPGV